MKESSPIVARCLEAGAVFLGLTTMPEFGMGPVTISPLSGITSNPWDTTKQAGGSSGGGAAGVSAGFSTLAVATDAGGSIRIPAALTGVVGFKPTGGRVPLFPASVAGGLSSNGPISRTVEEAALVLGLASRHDARDATALPPDGETYVDKLRGGVKGWKIALSTTLGYARKVDPEVAAAIRKAAGSSPRWAPSSRSAIPASRIRSPPISRCCRRDTAIRCAICGRSRVELAVAGPARDRRRIRRRCRLVTTFARRSSARRLAGACRPSTGRTTC